MEYPQLHVRSLSQPTRGTGILAARARVKHATCKVRRATQVRLHIVWHIGGTASGASGTCAVARRGALSGIAMRSECQTVEHAQQYRRDDEGQMQHHVPEDLVVRRGACVHEDAQQVYGGYG